MLTVAKVAAGVAPGYADYLQGKAQAPELGDYYLKDGERVEAPGRWVTGASTVGADAAAPVDGGELRELMAVRRPDTGGPLRRAGGNGEAVSALDATFSAPKSVSAVWALSGSDLRERIEAAHETAVDRALRYATEQVAMIRRRVDRQRVIHVPAREVVATSWRHTTARAVAGRPSDPQLHSHVLLHAAARGDGQLVAIDSRSWLVHGREVGAAYRTELARELHGLGFEICRGTGRGARYFELEGVPAALIDKWSSRHHQVQAAIDMRLAEKEAQLAAVIASGGDDAPIAATRLDTLRASGRLSAGEDRFLGQSTRAAKRLLQTRTDLDNHWASDGRSAGFDARRVEGLRSANVSRPIEPASDRELLERMTEFDATFADRDVRAVALECFTGAGIQVSLRAADDLRISGELLALTAGRHTTRTHRAIERDTVQIAEQLAAGWVLRIPPALVRAEAVALDARLRTAGGRLVAEQRQALGLACSERQLVVIEGQAGTGKSTVLAAVARAHQAAGQRIVVTSTAALAAERLARELTAAGATTDAYSTMALDAAITARPGTINSCTTVIHDEAALASTREQHQLLAAVHGAGARLIEVGDPKQSQAVGAGGLWPRLEQAARAHEAHVELTLNVRAQDEADRRDQALFRAGESEPALAGYATRGRVHLNADQARDEDAALEAAHQDRRAGRRALVIAQTSNEHLDELNARGQAIRAEHGELGHPGLALAGRPYELHVGDEIQVRNTIKHPKVGLIRNGTAGTIANVDPDAGIATVELSDRRQMPFEQDELDRAGVRLAYVQHPFPAQGLTSDTTHLIVAQHATREGSYVALTRARDRTDIYASRENLELDQSTDPLAALAGRMSREEPDLPSISIPLAHEQDIEQQSRLEHEIGPQPVAPERDKAASFDPAIPDNPAPSASRNDPGATRPGGSDVIQIGDATNRDPEGQARCEHDHPPGYVVAALGPTPGILDPSRHAWKRGVRAIERYRDQYNIGANEPLGAEPAAGRFQQRHDRQQAAAQIKDARAQLAPSNHRDEVFNWELSTPGLPIEDRGADNGWEL